jgi:hypothetical protein
MTTVWNIANLGFLIPAAVDKANMGAVVKPFQWPVCIVPQNLTRLT